MKKKNLKILFVIILVLFWHTLQSQNSVPFRSGSGISVLLIDTDRHVGRISEDVYGQFLEHINHSVVDGLFAEQVRGNGFEGEDFETYWKPFGENGSVRVVETDFNNGDKSLQVIIQKSSAGIQQGRFYFQQGYTYSGSLWLNIIAGSPRLTIRLKDKSERLIKQIPMNVSGQGWKEIPFSFYCTETDTQTSLEI